MSADNMNNRAELADQPSERDPAHDVGANSNNGAVAHPSHNSAPHPIDNEWRLFGDYYKCCYDVRELGGGRLISTACWPNAGGIRAAGRRYEAGECEVRISPYHPYGGVQITPDLIEHLERVYGKWQPANGDDGPAGPSYEPGAGPRASRSTETEGT